MSIWLIPEGQLVSDQQKSVMCTRLGLHIVMQLVIMSARCTWPYSKGYDMETESRKLITLYQQAIDDEFAGLNLAY